MFALLLLERPRKPVPELDMMTASDGVQSGKLRKTPDYGSGAARWWLSWPRPAKEA
jgi:hypothetical protein